MSPIEIGLLSVVAIVVLIYLGRLHPDRAWRGLLRVDLADARQFRSGDEPPEDRGERQRDGIHLRHRAAVHLHGADRVQGRAGSRHLRRDEHRLSPGQRRDRHGDRRRQRGLRRRHRLVHRLGLGVFQGLGAADAEPRLQPALRRGGGGGLVGARHDHPALGDADHLFLRRRTIGGRHVPRRRRARPDAGRGLCRRDLGRWAGSPRVSSAAARRTDLRAAALGRDRRQRPCRSWR